MRYQRTIKDSVECIGIGLHTGINVSLRLSPAPPDTGIVFIRNDKKSSINARVGNIVATDYSSTLGLNGSSIQTVEHLLAAIAGLHIDNLYFDHPLLNKQRFVYHYSIDSFIKEIAPARTFGFLKDVTTLQEKGLGKGGSLNNVVILGDLEILNEEGLRYDDEFIRHKVLDLIGDMSLLSMSFIGHITAYRSGHNLNTRLAAAILDNSDKWIEVGQSEKGLL